MKIPPRPAGFRGEAPRLDADKLPEGMAQIAQNCRLFSGSLEAWRDLALQFPLAKGGDIVSIYPMDLLGASGGPYWLHWNTGELGATCVKFDVARGAIPGDVSERSYITGGDAPRVTTLMLATTGGMGGAYPYNTYLLGVPAPADAPDIAVLTTDPTQNSITLTNPGAELGNSSGWNVTNGDLNVHHNGDVAGLMPHSGNYYFYGGAAASLTQFYQSIDLIAEGVLTGQSMELGWWQASGANGSTAHMSVAFYDTSSTLIGTVSSDEMAITPGLTWQQRSLTAVIPALAREARLLGTMTRVGAGENDAYIDDITVSVTGDSTLRYDGSSLDDFQTQTGGTNASIVVDTSTGWPAPSFQFRSRSNAVAAIYKDLALTRTAKTTVEFDYYTDGNYEYVVLAMVIGANGQGKGTSINFQTIGVQKLQEASWTSIGSSPATLSGGNHRNVVFHAVVTITKSGDAQADITFVTKRQDNGAIIAQGSATIALTGDFVGFKGSNGDGDAHNGWLDNLVIVSTPPESTSVAQNKLSNYVETYVNLFGEESAPSPPSRSFQLSDSASVQITTATAVPGGYGIQTKRRYRAASSSTGAVYLMVEEIPIATATTIDTKTDDQLGIPLEPTADWIPPISTMRCILSLANGITAGISDNQWCPSVVNRPHAWPTGYRLSTDFPIVAQGAIDTDIVLTTQTHVYIITGSDPAQMSMSKPEPGGCVSERSMVSMLKLGVVFAGQDGLIVASRGGITNITETLQLLSAKEWLALKPSSILGIAHQGRYYGFYDDGAGNSGGFILDPTDTGFGWTRLDFHATAGYSNPSTSELFLVIAGSLYKWDGDAAKRPYLWRSKQYEMAYAGSFEFAQVRAADYTDIQFRLYYDDVLVMDTPVTSGLEFLLPGKTVEHYVEYELAGTSTIKSVVIADSADDLQR